MVRVSMEHPTSPATFLLSTHQEQRISRASNSPCSAPWKPSPEWPSGCPLLPRDKTRLLLKPIQLCTLCLFCNLTLRIHIFSLIVNWGIPQEYLDYPYIPVMPGIVPGTQLVNDWTNEGQLSQPVAGKAAADRWPCFVLFLRSKLFAKLQWGPLFRF